MKTAWNETCSLFKESFHRSKDVKVIVGTALFIAMNVVLDTVKIVVIPKTLEIHFSTLALGACAYMFGPFVGGLMGIICDNLKYFLNPSGVYMPLFGINEILTGVIYGLFFYKKEISIKRVILARFLVVITCNMLLTPLWLHILYKDAFIVYFTARIVKNIVMFPVDCFLLYTVLKATKNIKKGL